MRTVREVGLWKMDGGFVFIVLGAKMPFVVSDYDLVFLLLFFF